MSTDSIVDASRSPQNSRKRLRIVYMGTPDFAVPPLQAIYEAGFDLAGVVTAPDRPAGRGQKLNASPIKVWAEHLNIPLLQPEKLRNPDFLTELAAWQADIFVVVAFRMLPEAVWNLPPLGALNLHASLLPEYRGAAPIHWAVIRGEKQTGLTTFRIEKDLDTGLIYEQMPIEIPDHFTTGDLHDHMSAAGAGLIVHTLQSIEAGTANPVPQVANETGFYARKIKPEDARIDWHQPAETLYHHIRGFSPWPGATTRLQDLQLKIYFTERLTEDRDAAPAGSFVIESGRWLVACGTGWLELTDVQLQGKRRMAASELLRGLRLQVAQFGD